MNDDLAARRAAVLERQARRRKAEADARVAEDCAMTIELLKTRAEIQRRIDQVNGLIRNSQRRHPSNGRPPYDQQQEEEQ